MQTHNALYPESPLILSTSMGTSPSLALEYNSPASYEHQEIGFDVHIAKAQNFMSKQSYTEHHERGFGC